MPQEWPGRWHSKEPSGEGITNDHGTRYLIDGGDYLYMEDVPPHLENRC